MESPSFLCSDPWHSAALAFEQIFEDVVETQKGSRQEDVSAEEEDEEVLGQDLLGVASEWPKDEQVQDGRHDEGERTAAHGADERDEEVEPGHDERHQEGERDDERAEQRFEVRVGEQRLEARAIVLGLGRVGARGLALDLRQVLQVGARAVHHGPEDVAAHQELQVVADEHTDGEQEFHCLENDLRLELNAKLVRLEQQGAWLKRATRQLACRSKFSSKHFDAEKHRDSLHSIIKFDSLQQISFE